MVNYRDPAIIMQDACAYTFSFGNARELVDITDFLGSCSVEALACCGWTLLVCLPRAGTLLS
jgi:hypothetical protein